VAPLLAKLLGDKDSEVRAQAARGLGDVKLASAREVLEKLLANPEPRVQFFAAQSLGKLSKEESAGPLLALLRANDNKDAYLRFAAANALSKLGAYDALAKAEKDPSAAVRLGVLLAYRYDQHPAAANFLNDADPFIAREAAEAINDAPIEAAYAPLAGKLVSASPDDQPVVVRALNANFRLGGAPRARAIANYALNDKATPEMRAEALKQLGLWGANFARDRVVGIYRPLHRTDHGPVLGRDLVHVVRCEDRAGARPILHDDRGTAWDMPAQVARYRACRQIVTAADVGTDHHGDALAGIELGN